MRHIWGGNKKDCIIVVEKSGGKELRGRPRQRWDDDIKMDLKGK
jgi:hypothetical protein